MVGNPCCLPIDLAASAQRKWLGETVALFLWGLAGVTKFNQLVSQYFLPLLPTKSLPKGIKLGRREEWLGCALKAARKTCSKVRRGEIHGMLGK